MTSDQSIGPENACTPERVKELADQGHGRNQIMRITGASQWHVDKAAETAGVTFDRERTRKAVESLIADAQLEREHLSVQFRQVARTILGKVLNADDLDSGELKDLMWAAGSSAASDARYGKLSLDQRVQQVMDHDGEKAAADFAELLHTIRDGFQTLEDTPMEELEGQDDADDEPP